MLSAVAGVAVQTLADVGVTEATRDVIAVHDRLEQFHVCGSRGIEARVTAVGHLLRLHQFLHLPIRGRGIIDRR